MSRLWNALASLAVVGALACGDPAGGVIRLETDHAIYVQELDAPPQAAIVSITNGGARPIIIPMCDLPGFEYDAAPLRLQRRNDEGEWGSAVGGFCPTSDGMYGKTVQGLVTTYASRLMPGTESGTYRFVLPYETDEGIEELAFSNEFTTTVPTE